MDLIPEPISVSVTLLSQMFVYLTAKGVNVDEFLASIGMDPGGLKSPDARVRVDTYLFIQEEAARRINDPYFGLHMGEYAEAGSWSILGYVMMNCKTLGEAAEKSARYSRIIGNMIESRTELHFNKVRVILFTPPGCPPQSRHCYEAALSSSIRMMRLLSGQPINPLKVTFVYPEPPDISEYTRIFGCPVLFGQKDTSMTLDIRLGNMPVRLANPDLLAAFEQLAQNQLADLDRQGEYTRAAARIIISHLDDEKLSIETVARQMAVSVRTLQKRLEEEGVVFSDLLREIRQRLAQKYLSENYSVEQITYLLGFSEPSAFRKAFKKWAGVTPGEYRQRASLSA